MDRIVVRTRVDPKGMLHVALPAGVAADQEVQVTVEPIADALSAAEWRQGVLETAGKWQGDFERPDQGAYEQRVPLS